MARFFSAVSQAILIAAASVSPDAAAAVTHAQASSSNSG